MGRCRCRERDRGCGSRRRRNGRRLVRVLPRRSGLDRVVLVEKRTLGQGASSRAAGVVRTQGGTPWAVQLGEWSRRFYLSQHDELGIDSGFTPQGYLLPCFTEAEVAAARARMAMQKPLGLSVRWLEPGQLDALNPTLDAGPDARRNLLRRGRLPHPAPERDRLRRGARNVRRPGPRAGQRFSGWKPAGSGDVTGVQTSAGPISAPLVVLTGGPELAEVARPGRRRGTRWRCPPPGRGHRAASGSGA